MKFYLHPPKHTSDYCYYSSTCAIISLYLASYETLNIYINKKSQLHRIDLLTYISRPIDAQNIHL